jgi:PAS domain S-box-containing protein
MKTGSRQIASAMPDMAWTALPDGTVDFVNERSRIYTGVDVAGPGGLIGALHPDDRSPMLEGWRAAFSRGEAFEAEVRGRRHDGAYRWFRIRIMPVVDPHGAIDHWFGTAIDVHDAHETHAALDAARAQTETILASISDAFFSLDRDWRFTYANPAAERLLRQSARDLLYKVVWDAFPTAVEAAFYERYEYAMRTGENVEFVEFFAPLDTWFEVRGYPHADGLSVYFRDVTERVERETELRENQAALEAALVKLQRILDHSVDAICVFTRDGKCVEINSRCLDIWGYEPSEMIGTNFAELVHPDDRHISRAQNTQIIGGQSARTLQLRNFRKDGSIVHLQWSSVWSEEEQLFFNIGRDISAQVDAERRLRQAQRLEVLGQLTGGVAHDFNNLLTVILGNAEFLADELGPDHELHQLTVAMQLAAERGSALNNRLLAFARRQALEPKVMDINGLVANMDQLLRRTLGEHVEIELVRAGGLWRAFIDPAQLEAAILNLCLNARDAMPTGGRLTIETGNAAMDGSYAANHEDVQPGQYVMIAVTDTGTGMTPDVIARAFEPFFTTKDVGKGSGLGLSMVYGFVKQSGGHIKIYSEIGQGTLVKLYLRRTHESGKEPARQAGDRGASSGNEKILLVEDDDLVRTHVDSQLRAFGYRVIAVSNGPEALEALKQIDDFDMLFTDVVMPRGMNGRQLAAEARLLWPDLPVLFTSGYTENAIIHHGRLDPGVHLVNKPYRREELARKVREVLDEARGDVAGLVRPQLPPIAP